MLPDCYEGVWEKTQAELVEKKSRFLAEVYPIRSEQEAESLIARARERHPGARHVCFAYRVGFDPVHERSSDDGEPSGTAGKPMLEVLQRRHLDQTLVLVIRYFGGILLGAPGLVRAYTQAACRGLDAAGRRRWLLCHKGSAQIEYHAWGKIEHLLSLLPVHIFEREFLDRVYLSVAAPVRKVEDVHEALSGAGAALDWQMEEEFYVAEDQLNWTASGDGSTNEDR